MVIALDRYITNITLNITSSTHLLIEHKVFLGLDTGEYIEALYFLMICVTC